MASAVAVRNASGERDRDRQPVDAYEELRSAGDDDAERHAPTAEAVSESHHGTQLPRGTEPQAPTM